MSYVQSQKANRCGRGAGASLSGGRCPPLLVIILFLIRSQAYHDPEDEPTAEPIDPSFFDFDSAVPLSKERLKGVRQPFP